MIKCVVFLLSISCFVSSELNGTWLYNVRIRRQSDSKNCILPPYPKNGQYTVGGQSSGQPGERYDAVQLHIYCHPGYQPLGTNTTLCVSGVWSQDMPRCVRHCRLDPHPSVTYRCLVNSDGSKDGYYGDCKQHEPLGRIVKPECNQPNYYYPGGVLPDMRCIEGKWNYIATCLPECGTIIPTGSLLIGQGREVERGKFPWYAGIYLKTTTPFRLICGGSLVSSTIVISAAHCFYHQNQPRTADSFAIALGKVDKPWNSQLDDEPQKFDVVDVKIPERYHSSTTKYQDDIAAAMLSAPAQFRPHVRPVCLNFDTVFNAQQLRDGNFGKVAVWDYIDSQGTKSRGLKVLEVPYVRIETCIEEAPSDFIPYITSDKICAGYQNGSAICPGNSGGGLVFPEIERAQERYYLSGVVSTAPRSNESCSTRIFFTEIAKHRAFIEKYTILSDQLSAPVDQIAEPKCILPPYPKNGQYTVGGQSGGRPGERYDAVQLHISCYPGYQPLGSNITTCFFGEWSHDPPQCVRHCRLDSNPSVRYRCLVNSDDSEDVYYRNCEQHEPSGTIVKPECNEPNYYFGGVLLHMHCIEGGWNHVASCLPECGIITPNGKPLIIGGQVTQRGEFPWHAGIYLKTTTPTPPFQLICGGSLVSSTVVISAAHCFWTQSQQKQRPASDFAIALGKFYREWNNPLDDEAQKYDVVEVKIPERYQNAATNYQDDIAVAILSAPAQYRPHIRPVCLNWDSEFDAHQLHDGNLGKVAGWGLIDDQGTASRVLKVLELPYVRIETCIREAPSEFRPFITSDKICAGYQNGSAVCRGDSGGGLVFPEVERAKKRYYLRGIVSTAPQSDQECNAFARTTFTQITKHRAFIEKNTSILGKRLALVEKDLDL